MGSASLHLPFSLGRPERAGGHVRPCLLSVSVCCPSLRHEGCPRGRWAQRCGRAARRVEGVRSRRRTPHTVRGSRLVRVYGLRPEAPLLGV